jgi:hypothetical protein
MNKESPGITSSSGSKEQMMQELENLVAMFIDTGYTCNATGLFDEKMGMVIFLFHHARQTRGVRFKNMAEMLIDEIQSAIHADFPIDYACGLTGIGVGIEYLVQQGFIDADTDDIPDDFDHTFTKQIHERKPYLSSHDLMDFKRFFY